MADNFTQYPEQLNSREQLLWLHQMLSDASREIMARKNHDYSKNGPFDNFRVCESLQITTAENGILIRMGDKLSRLVSIATKGSQVSDESVLDTVLDVMNYAVLYYGVFLDKNKNAQIS